MPGLAMTLTVDIEVVGMTDDGDASKVAAALQSQPGVTQVQVQLSTGIARTEIEKGTIVEHLLETVEETGFMARLAKGD